MGKNSKLPGERRKTKELSIKEKLSLIEYSHTHTVRDTAKKFNVGLGTVVNTKKRKDEYLKLHENIKEDRKRKFKHTPYEELNQLCWSWFNKSRSMKVPLSGPIIQETARKLAFDLKLSSFKASNGWLQGFIRSHNINLKVISDEDCGGCDVYNNLNAICNNYLPSNIFAINEISLNWKALPDGVGRNSRDRVMLLVGMSALGEKLKGLVVGVKETKQKFSDKLIFTYCWDENSWLTENIFTDWLQTCNENFAKQNRKVLFLLSSLHTKTCLSNITLHYLPLTTPSPLQHGIIRNLKNNYRCCLLRHLITSSHLHINHQISLNDLLMWLHHAYTTIDQTTIINAFHQSGIISTTAIPSDTDSQLENLIAQAQNTFLLKHKLSLDEYHQLDELNEAADDLMLTEGDQVVNHTSALNHIRGLKSFVMAGSVDGCLDEVLLLERKVQEAVIESQKYDQYYF